MSLPFISGRGNRGGSFAAGPAAPVADTGGVTRQSDLLHWWKLDEGTGDVVNDSIETDSQDLAKNGGALWAAGRDGSSLSLDGTGDYYTTEDSMTAHTGPYALSAWCYPTLDGSSQRPVVMLASSSWQGANQQGHFLGFEAGNNFTFWHNDVVTGYGWEIIDSTGSLALNRWYFLCGTYDDDGNIDFYWADASTPDSVVTDAGTLSTAGGQFNALDSWSIGAGFGAKDFAGQIDDVRFYGAYLSESDVNDIYNGGSGDFV